MIAIEDANDLKDHAEYLGCMRGFRFVFLRAINVFSSFHGVV